MIADVTQIYVPSPTSTPNLLIYRQRFYLLDPYHCTFYLRKLASIVANGLPHFIPKLTISWGSYNKPIIMLPRFLSVLFTNHHIHVYLLSSTGRLFLLHPENQFS